MRGYGTVTVHHSLRVHVSGITLVVNLVVGILNTLLVDVGVLGVSGGRVLLGMGEALSKAGGRNRKFREVNGDGERRPTHRPPSWFPECC